MTDIRMIDHRTIVGFAPAAVGGADWLRDNLPDGYYVDGEALVDFGYGFDVLQGMIADGLAVAASAPCPGVAEASRT